MSKYSASVKRPPTPDPEEDNSKELKLEEKIRYQLIASGQRDRLKKLLAEKLDSCGWRDEIKQRSKEYVRGRENVTTEEIVKAIRPEGRASVPDSIKAELLGEIKKFILSL